MRFTDNPLEGLMRQSPVGGQEAVAACAPPPFCEQCPYRSFICNFGICWHPDREKDNTPKDNETK